MSRRSGWSSSIFSGSLPSPFSTGRCALSGGSIRRQISRSNQFRWIMRPRTGSLPPETPLRFSSLNRAVCAIWCSERNLTVSRILLRWWRCSARVQWTLFRTLLNASTDARVSPIPTRVLKRFFPRPTGSWFTRSRSCRWRKSWADIRSAAPTCCVVRWARRKRRKWPSTAEFSVTGPQRTGYQRKRQMKYSI